MFGNLEGITAERPQKAATMRVLLIDTEKTAPQIIETPGGLNEWYRLIGCNLIDIQVMTIDGRQYDIITDDEALYKGGAKVSGIDAQKQPILAGNLIICNSNDNGEEIGLSDDDIKHIMGHIAILKLPEPMKGRAEKWAALCDLEP